MITRRLALGLMLATASVVAHAESYPARPIKIVVPEELAKQGCDGGALA